MKEMHTTERVIRNWIDENEECMKSLWFQLLRCAYFANRLCSWKDGHYEELRQKLIKHSSAEHIRAGNLNENTMYLASNNNGIFCEILIGQPSTINLVSFKLSESTCEDYELVDVGEMKFVDRQGIFSSLPIFSQFRHFAFAVYYPVAQQALVNLSSTNENNICLCKIYKILPPHFSGYFTAMYPPVVFLQLYKFISYHNKYDEVIFKRIFVKSVCLCQKSRTIASNNEYLGCQYAVPNTNLVMRKNGQSIKKKTSAFQRSYKLYDVKAIVTAKIRRNVYWMRDADILSILYENLVDPGKHSKYKSVNSMNMHNEMCCMMWLARPFRKHSPAVVTHFHEETDTCLAYLVDFGLSIVCNIKNCKEQPAVIRETSSAAFKCCVNRSFETGKSYFYNDLSDECLVHFPRSVHLRSEITLTSIELDILKISEKIDNITSAKLASLHMTSVTANLLEKKIALDMNEPVTSFIRLRKRAPIYQIQHDDLLDVLEEQLDSLQPTSLISEEELQVGTLCVSFCRTFDSLFRAVITNINNIGIEVHYVDYGNYETVNRDDQMSIFNLSDVARTYPGMAIPCMLFNSLVSSTVSNSAETEDEFITNLKDAVSCEHHSFRIRILQIREDRICIVEYISSTGELCFIIHFLRRFEIVARICPKLRFAGPSSGSGIPESSYNLHGGVETITGIRQNGISTIKNRNNLRKFRAHHIMGNSQLPLGMCF
ncbi:unnamed protein product [Brugia pahangi]|uniref:Tudor domain-containing protein n=1 Tax=Brugia pahangi TaxID=6280 RepID=A0A0N4TZG7_BRUPA|nr:unnamed protein product [Brugia pahangi]